jgi:hypothetical protein
VSHWCLAPRRILKRKRQGPIYGVKRQFVLRTENGLARRTKESICLSKEQGPGMEKWVTVSGMWGPELPGYGILATIILIKQKIFSLNLYFEIFIKFLNLDENYMPVT